MPAALIPILLSLIGGYAGARLPQAAKALAGRSLPAALGGGAASSLPLLGRLLSVASNPVAGTVGSIVGSTLPFIWPHGQGEAEAQDASRPDMDSNQAGMSLLEQINRLQQPNENEMNFQKLLRTELLKRPLPMV